MNELIYEIATNSFVVAWLLLVIGSLMTNARWRRLFLLTGGRIIPVILLACFAIGFFVLRSSAQNADLRSLQGAIDVFSQPQRFLIIWVEFLAYALFAGCWISEHGARHRAPRLIVTPCVALTFISGGLALVAYLIAIGAIFGLRGSPARRSQKTFDTAANKGK